MAVRRLDLIVTSNATAALRGFVNLGGAANAAERKFGKFGAVASRALIGAGVAGAAFAIKSAKSFIDFDDAMSQSLAIMGDISGPMRKRMEDAAKKVATTTTHSATEAAESYFFLASAGLDAEQSIKALPKVAKFAQAGNFDMARATDLLTDAQSALGLSFKDPIKNTKEMIRVSDVLVKANQMANATVEQFSEALTNKAAAALKTRNKDIEEGVAVLAYFADQGVKGSIAGERLNVVLRDIPRAAQKNADVFREFGVEVFDADGNMRNLADVVEEFEKALGPMSDGQRAATLDQMGLTRSVADAIQILMGGSEQIREYEKGARSAGEATDEVANKQMESLKNQLGLLKDRFEVFMITVGEPIAVWFVETLIPYIENVAIPTLVDLVNVVRDELAPAFEALEPVVETVKDILADPTVQKAIQAYAAFAIGVKAIAPALTLVMGIMKVFLLPFKLLMFILSPLISVIGFLITTFGIIPVAIAAVVVAAGFLVYYFREEIVGAILAVADWFNRLWQDYIHPFVVKIGGFLATLGGHFSGVISAITDFAGELKQGISDIVQEIKETFQKGFFEWILRTIPGVIMGVVRIIGIAVTAVADLAVRLFNPVKTIVMRVFDVILTIGQQLLPIIGGIISSIFNGIVGVIRGAWQFISNIVQAILNVFQGEWGAAWDNVKAAFGGIWDAIFEIFRTALTTIKELFFNLPQALWQILQTAVPALIAIGWQLVQGLWQGLQVAFKAVLRLIGNLFMTIVDVVKRFFGISSPSTVFAEIGSWLIEGLWNGIKAVLGPLLAFIKWQFQLWSSVVKIAFQAIIAVVSVAWNGVIKPIFQIIAAVIRNVLIPVFKFLWEAIKVAWDGIKTAISAAWNFIRDYIFAPLQRFIRNNIVPVFRFLWDVITSVWDGIKTAIGIAWNFIRDYIFAPLQRFIRNNIVPVFRFLRDVAKAVWEKISSAISTAWAFIRDYIFAPLQRFIRNNIVPVFRFLRDVAKAVWEKISSAISTAWAFIRDYIFAPLRRFIKQTLIPTFETLRDIAKAVWEKIRDVLAAGWRFMRDRVFDPLRRLLTKVKDRFQSVKDAIVLIWTGLKDAMKGIWDKINDVIKGGINKGIGFVNSMIGGLKKVLETLGLKSVADKLGTIGKVGNKRTAAPRGGGANAPGGGAVRRGMKKGGNVEPFVTDGPRAIVGEGNPRYPEFVIPTDPLYRKRAVNLYGQLGGRLMSMGGYLGMDPGFGAKVQKVVQESGGAVTVVSGFRSRAKQQELYSRYLAGTGNLAAKPGSSKHEKGVAVDFGGNRALYQRLWKALGGTFPVGGEPWHGEHPSHGGGGGGGGGGLLSTAGDILKGFASGFGLAGGLANSFGTDAVWAAVNAGLNKIIDGIPLEWVREIARWGKDQVGKWVTDRDRENSVAEGSDPSGGGGGGNVERWRGTALQALRATGSPTSWIGSLLRRMNQESGGNPRAVNNWDDNARRGTPSKGLMQCLPLDADILTDQGWKRHDEVEIGDKTLGYNPATGRNEWTSITKKVYYDDAPIVRIGNKHWSARVTPNHRWFSDSIVVIPKKKYDICPECGWASGVTRNPTQGVATHRALAHGVRAEKPQTTTRGEFVRTYDLKAKHRIRLTAVAETDGIPGLSLEDIAVIGWLQGDGHIRRAETDEERWDGSIYQSKPPMVAKLRSLLRDVPHGEGSRDRGGNTMTAHIFRLGREYVTDLMRRSQLMERSAEDFVLAMSPSQRRVWLTAMIDAEGHTADNFTRIAQVDGELQEAIKLAVYLEGYRPTYSANSAERNGYKPAGVVGMAHSHVTPASFHEPEVLPNETVWCVKTDLETWTMRQDGQIMLTGNTIQTTFDAHAGAYRSRGIFDPMANIVASINYANSRYGNAPAGWNQKGGYAKGGIVDGDQMASLHDKEMVLPPRLSRFVQEAASDASDRPTVVINNLTINANDEEGGKRAARAFEKTLQERRLMVDARIR